MNQIPTIIMRVVISCLALLLVLADGAPGEDKLAPQMEYEAGTFASVSTSVIHLGASISFLKTDKYGYGGRMIANGWDMFVNWINIDQGGMLVGNTTYSFQLSYVEDYSDRQYVSFVYSELLKAVETDFFFGPFSSALTASALTLTEPAEQLLLSASASNSSLFVDSDLAFSLQPSNIHIDEVPFQLFSSKGAASIAVLYDVGYAACDNASSSAQLADTYGIELNGHYFFDSTDPLYEDNIKSVMVDLKAANVEAVHACSYLQLCVEVSSSPCI